jgi:hypothetical protein
VGIGGSVSTTGVIVGTIGTGNRSSGRKSSIDSCIFLDRCIFLLTWSRRGCIRP